MKYGSERKQNPTSMHRSREHAKQIAMSLGDNVPSPMSAFTAASSSFANFDAAFANNDPFASNNAFEQDPFGPSKPRNIFDDDPFADNSGRSQRRTAETNFQVDWPNETQTMATLPANSSMQASFANQQQQQQTPHSPAPSYGSSSMGSAGGAAARRRIRNQMRKSSQRSEPELAETPPQSPHSVKRYHGSDSNGTRAKATDHLSNYSMSQRAPIASANRSITSASRSVASSTSSSSVHLYDPSNPHAGFTFDAFGLDASQINREVSEAMHDIAGAHPDLSFFLDQDPTDDFAAGRWDSPAASRSSTPVEEEEEDGFVDGFRVTKPMPMHVKQSPTSTERSSLTSESSEKPHHDGVNLFKEKAGFYATTTQRKVIRPLQQPSSLAVRQGLRMPDLEDEPVTKPPRPDVEFFEADFSGMEQSSQVGASDVGVSSDFGAPALDFAPPLEVAKSKPKPSFTVQTGEEKKDEDERESPGRSVSSPSVGNLKAKWEVQSTQPLAKAPAQGSSAPASAVARMQAQRSPISQSPRAAMQQRPAVTSRAPQLESLDISTKSEGGAAIRSSHVNSILSRIERESPRDTHSDTGAPSPSFANVQLRRTGFSSPRHVAPAAAPAANHRYEPRHAVVEDEAPDDEEPVQEPERKLTYRERRELELQRQREEEHRAAPEPSEPVPVDVATLIKRRIAANKRENEMDLQSHTMNGVHAKSLDPSFAASAQRSPPRNGRYDVLSELAVPRGPSDEEHSSKSHHAALLRLREVEVAPPKTSPKRGKGPSSMTSPQRPPALTGLRTNSQDDGERSSMSGGKGATPKATMMMLNAFLAGRESLSSHDGASHGAKVEHGESADSQEADVTAIRSASSLPALKDDPDYERYFKMLKMGLPMEVVKHAMTRDGLDPSVMDGDHNKPVGVPLKHDPEYAKYFKMLSIGLPMDAVKHAMERDGLDSTVMDQDHDLPAHTNKKKDDDDEPKEKDSHRRARLHWKPLRKVTKNSLWAKIDQDDTLGNIEIDEEEFQELFQVDKATEAVPKAVANSSSSGKRGAVRVIDPKRANNGGIILARLKMSHDDMADAVDRINENSLTAEQIENIIEYLPTKDERKALEAYMLGGGQDAAEKFDGLCECEKFMVSMMTVKHAKRKVRALLFKLQFQTCLEDIYRDTVAIESACDELCNSVRLRQLLGIVLTFGNRLNTAGNGQRKAGAFTLDSLLKLNQAKAFDKKTTFLHYIILIVRRNNELLLNFKDDLPTVFEADKVYWDQCVNDLEEVENQLENVRKIALYQARQAVSFRQRRKKREDDEESLSDADVSLSLAEEVEALRATPIGMFTLSAIKYVSSLRDKVEDTKAKYSRLLEYFGEEEGKMQPHELFSTIVVFSRDFDKAKETVFEQEKKKMREERKRQAKGKSQVAKQQQVVGRPPTYSPANQERKTADHSMLKASNFQPSMSSVLSELKSRTSPAPAEQACAPVYSSPSPAQQAPSQPRSMDQSPSYQPSAPTAPSPASPTKASIRMQQQSLQTPVRSSLAESQSNNTPPAYDSKASNYSPMKQSTPAVQSSESAPNSASRPSSSTRAALRQKARLRSQRLRNSSPPPQQPTKAFSRAAADDGGGAAQPLSPRASMRQRMEAHKLRQQSAAGVQ